MSPDSHQIQLLRLLGHWTRCVQSKCFGKSRVHRKEPLATVATLIQKTALPTNGDNKTDQPMDVLLVLRIDGFPGIPTTFKTMGVNITTIVYLNVLIIQIGSTIILMVVEAQGIISPL